MIKKSYIDGEICVFSVEKIDINILRDELRQEDKLPNIVEFSKVMSDKTRSSIIYLIYKNKELCVCGLANILDMSSQAISSQLIKLYDKGFIKRKRKGLTVYYSLLNEEFIEFIEHIL